MTSRWERSVGKKSESKDCGKTDKTENLSSINLYKIEIMLE
jgi:hypothetical protein